jgi:carbamoyltransferase
VIVLGINAYHGDASAALLIDGTVVAAAEEERFTRQKHQAGFPEAAIRWCLDAAGVAPTDIAHVAVSRDPFANLGRKLAWTALHRPTLRSIRDRGQNAGRVLGTRDALATALDVDAKSLAARFHRVEHHRAHLGSALFCSPHDDAACLSVDGMGDFVSAMWGQGAGNHLDVRGDVGFPHSLGVFYTAFTQFLGLPAYGDEYKLMGLAAYGEPVYLDQLRQVLTLDDGGGLGFRLDLDWFVHHDRGVDMTWSSGTPSLGPLWSPHMAHQFGAPRPVRGDVTDRDRDLAASVQARLEEVELELLRRLHARVQSPRLVMAGGVALNCVVNGKIRAETPFEDVWVQPAANDAGTSVGAALWVWNQKLGMPRGWEMTHAYLGPDFDAEACAAAVTAAGLHGKTLDDGELYEYVAGRIADGAVVGWYQGATEFGPRALGNRSIVADPRRADMKDILNARIKFREAFRPFAPSVLVEATGEWFTQDAPSPFMLMTYGVRPERRAQIPAVTHEDGTARLQTVDRVTNPRYYELIAAFARLTGVPILLNTSLNENEPIVCRPEEALACFQRTEMDVLVLHNIVLES